MYAQDASHGDANGTPTGGDADRLSDDFTRFLALDKCLPRRRFLQVRRKPAAQQVLVLLDQKNS